MFSTRGLLLTFAGCCLSALTLAWEPDPRERKVLGPWVSETQARACVEAALELLEQDSDYRKLITGLPADYPVLPGTEKMRRVDVQSALADQFNKAIPYSNTNFAVVFDTLRTSLNDETWIKLLLPLVNRQYQIRNPVLIEMHKLIADNPPPNDGFAFFTLAVQKAEEAGKISNNAASELIFEIENARQTNQFELLRIQDRKDFHMNRAIPHLILDPTLTLPLNSVAVARTTPYRELAMQAKFFFEDSGLSKYQFDSQLYFGFREIAYLSPAEIERRRVRFSPKGRLLNHLGEPMNAYLPVTIVMDKDGNWYVGHHDRLTEDRIGAHSVTAAGHSALTRGRPIAFAGMAVIKDGKIASLNRDSGHYMTSLPYFLQGIEDLERKKAFDRKRDYGLLNFNINNHAKKK